VMYTRSLVKRGTAHCFQHVKLFLSVCRAQRADAAGELRSAHEGGEGGAGGGAAGEHHAAGSERGSLMPHEASRSWFASSVAAV